MEGVSREQVINRIRDERFTFSRKADRVEIWRQRGTAQRVNIPRRDILSITTVRVILAQAGLTPDQVESFLRQCVKTSCGH